MYSKNPEYAELAGRIVISNHHKQLSNSYLNVISELYSNGIIEEYLYELVLENEEEINNEININKDYNIDFFGFKTLEKSYLLKIKDKIVETPQYLFMRVA